MSYFPQGATASLPGGSSAEPWGSNDRWSFLAATVNRFVDGGVIGKAGFRYPVERGQITVINAVPGFVWGPSLAVALAAFTLYQQRVYEGGNQAEIATLAQAGKDDSSTVKYVAANVAPITATLAQLADARGYPPAVGVQGPGLPLVPIAVIGGIAFLLLRKKGRR